MSDLLYIIATLLTLLQVSCANVKKTEAVAVVPIETPREMGRLLHFGGIATVYFSRLMMAILFLITRTHGCRIGWRTS